ncbi:uncharacterized protein LOC119740343 [Patiria miniata]|uniref:Uncharacterized protein n=1 Tax=Patiria miniata TaxID=46514 RepID=A0A914B2J7_PATMI|nr:uncharacterized protein LOC119739378 [Patiria miniata]XP_038071536.1 uncharacterized protein LOC119740343 [Patiria miniata]
MTSQCLAIRYPYTRHGYLALYTMASTSSAKKSSTRFYPALDILVLKQVLADWPIGDTKKWETLTQKLNEAVRLMRPDGQVTMRGCKDRFRKLLSAFKADELASLRASGTDEEYGERERLLGEIVELESEMDKMKEDAAKVEKKKLEQGETVRQKALQSLTEQAEGLNDEARMQTPSPLKKRKKVESSDYIQYLKEKTEKEFAFKQQQLELDKERFVLEKKERQAKLAYDSQVLHLLLKLTKKED